jgi:hypothetical protein
MQAKPSEKLHPIQSNGFLTRFIGIILMKESYGFVINI